MTEINKSIQLKQNEETSYIIEEGKKIYPVYNNSNQLITIDDIADILEKGNLKEEIKYIKNIKLLQQSFIHKSMCVSSDFEKYKKYFGNINALQPDEIEDYVKLQENSNETLEWYGDADIQSMISKYLFKRFKDEDEGFLTRLRSRLVKTETLSKLALVLNFDKYMIISKHVEIIMTGRKNAKLLEDCFEAFLGVLFLNFEENIGEGNAYVLVKKFLIYLYENYIDFTVLIEKDDNFKDQLMKYFQKEFNGEYPKYEQISETKNVSFEGISNRKFRVCVRDTEGNIVGEGIAQGKKEAEQKAAQNALKHYGVL